MFDTHYRIYFCTKVLLNIHSLFTNILYFLFAVVTSSSFSSFIIIIIMIDIIQSMLAVFEMLIQVVFFRKYHRFNQ